MEVNRSGCHVGCIDGERRLAPTTQEDVVREAYLLVVIALETVLLVVVNSWERPERPLLKS